MYENKTAHTFHMIFLTGAIKLKVVDSVFFLEGRV